MLSLLFILAVLWLGLVLDDDFEFSRGDFLLRLGAAVMLGFFWGTWLVYLLAWCFGFTFSTVAAALALILLFNAYAWKRRGRNLRWLASLLTFRRPFWKSYGIFVVVILAFFVCQVWTRDDGEIRYWGNFTDLAFHMGTASAFLEQSAFPPLNPQFASAKLSYHFMADFTAAILCRGGFELFDSFKVLMSLLAFSLATLTCHFFDSLLKRRAAAVCASTLFFFGHIGFIHLLYGWLGYPVGNVPLTFTWAGLEEHIAYPYFNFLNVLVDFFQPQLAFLFGFPLGILILLVLYRQFSREETRGRTMYFVLALVALLPLFHMHSFLVLAPLIGLLFLLEWRTAIAGGRVPAKVAGVLLAATAIALQLGFILSQKKAPGFSGFDVLQRFRDRTEIPDFLHARPLWYWLRVAGPTLILGLTGIAVTRNLRRRVSERPRANFALLVLFAVTGAYFVVINFYRFTPAWGDSNKFFLYWNVMLCLYAGNLLALAWDGPRWRRVAASVVVAFSSVLPFAIEWNLRFRRGPSTLFTASDRIVADWIRTNTPKDAVFLTANSYTHYVTALAGRRVINGSYTRETGYADDQIEAAVRNAYREADPSYITSSHVDYIVVGPDERNGLHISRSLLAQRHKLVFDQVSQGQRYSIYETRPVPPEVVARERAAREARGFIWLSELDPDYQRQFGTLQFDETFDHTPLTLNDHVYQVGLGTHAPSEIKFDLDHKYSSFEADIGVDDLQRGTVGSVIFKIKVEGQLVYTSYVLRGGAPHEHVKVDLTNATTLILIVEDAGDGNHNDHADWADAKLTLASQP